MPEYVFHEPKNIDFDRFGHTGKFLGTDSPFTQHLIIETNAGYEMSLRENQCEFDYYIIAGSGEFVINGQTYPCKIGDLIVIPPRAVFTVNGQLKMLLINTPRYTPEQEDKLPKDAASSPPTV